MSATPCSCFFFLVFRLPPSSTLFPYTTLFRSGPRSGSLGTCSLPGLIDSPRRSCTRRRAPCASPRRTDRKSTRLNSSHANISYAVFCLKKKRKRRTSDQRHPERETRGHQEGNR